MTTQKYDWKITAKKFGADAAIIICLGLIAYWQDNPVYFGVIPFLTAIINFLKHRND